MREITLRAYGKINWSLDVTGKRDDGYHLLDMILHSVDICDEVSMEKANELSITSDSGDVPCDQSNIVWRAIDVFSRKYNTDNRIKVHIKKNIPIQAGMAGGSADGAAALEALYRLYNIDETMENKLSLALSLGADVPFVLQGGLARVQGIGEKLQFHSCQHQYKLLILCPHKGASTAQIFKSLDISKIEKRPDNVQLLNGLLTGNIDCISKQMINALQDVTVGYVPEVRQAVEHQYLNGALGAVMTGSGSAVIGVYANEESRNRAYDRLSGMYKAHYAETCSGGVTI